MSGSRTINTLIAIWSASAVLASGGPGWGGLNLAAGTAHADPCNSPGPTRGPARHADQITGARGNPWTQLAGGDERPWYGT